MTLNLEEKTQILNSSTEEVLEDFLRERTKEVSVSPEDFSKDTLREGDYGQENRVTLEKAREIETEHGDSLEPIKTEAIEQAEQEKFDELDKAVDKFEALAMETRKVEKELKDAEETREEHYSSTASLGRTVRSDNRRETEFVALKTKVRQKLKEMIALKKDILDKLSDIKNVELRLRVYDRFKKKIADEVGMSSEVLLETVSAKHQDDLRHEALHQSALDIIGPNLERKAKKKELESAKTIQPIEADDSLKKEDIAEPLEKGSGDHLLPGIDLEVEGESAKGEDIEIARAAGPELSVEEEPAAPPLEVLKPEVVPESIPVPEPKTEPHTYVEMMEIGGNGELRSVVNTTGELKEDSIAAGAVPLAIKTKPANVAEYIQAEKKEFEGEVDTVRKKVTEIADRIPGVQFRPIEQPRNIDNIAPPAPKAEQPIVPTPDQSIDSIKSEPVQNEITVDAVPAIATGQAEPEQQAPEPLQKQGGGFLSRLFGRKSDGTIPTNTEDLVKHIDRKGGELDTSHIFNATNTEPETKQMEKAA